MSERDPRFLLKRWDVSVPGYGVGTYCRPTRGKALSDAWRSDVFNNVSFGEFIRVARCRRSPVDPPDFGTPITVLGRPAFFVGRDSQYVSFAWPDGEFTLHAHPLDVLPEEFRPQAYRTRARASTKAAG